MTIDNYKSLITERIKDSINGHIDQLKESDKDLHLTKQWSIIFPKGFKPGNIELPVVTNSMKGKHLIGELFFIIPATMELDLDSIELTLKNEPFVENPKKDVKPVPLDEPLDVMNRIVIGLNDFLVNLNISAPASPNQFKTMTHVNPINSAGAGSVISRSGLKVNSMSPANKLSLDVSDINGITRQLLSSIHLPDWFTTIESKGIKDELIKKIAESYAHYDKQTGGKASIREFFEKYTQLLKDQNKLFPYCKYKSKPIVLNSLNQCSENYCSKKPYNSECGYVVHRFGLSK